VFGVPWSLAYVVVVILCNFVVLVALYLTRAIDATEHEDDAGG
jgi:hypothetical protein